MSRPWTINLHVFWFITQWRSITCVFKLCVLTYLNGTNASKSGHKSDRNGSEWPKLHAEMFHMSVSNVKVLLNMHSALIHRVQGTIHQFKVNSALEERIIEVLISGIKYTQTQKKLLGKDNKLKLQDALDICRTHEASCVFFIWLNSATSDTMQRWIWSM